MPENFKSRSIGVSVLCRISASGGGIYLYLPKNFAEVYDIIGCDFVEVYLRKVFSKQYDEDASGAIDLRRKGRKQSQELLMLEKESKGFAW